MKKLIKYFVVMITAALLSLTLFACGSNVKYNFKETTIEGEGEMASSMSFMKTTYDTLYKDSTIEVGDGDIVWKMKDAEQKLTYEKDGDKYILAGEYTDTLKNSLSSIGGGEVSIEMAMWGAETDDGFKIVMEEKVESTTVSIVLNFTKA